MEKRRRSTPAPPRFHLADHLAPPPRPIPSSVSTASPPCPFCARRCRPYRALGAWYAAAGIPPPPLRRGEHPATQPSPALAPFLLAPALHKCSDTFAPSPGPQSSLARARRRALPCRAAVAGAHAAQSLPDPDLSPRRVHHSVLIILGPSPGRIDPRSAGLGVSGDPSAAEALFRRSAPPPARPTRLGRLIRNKRPRLDPAALKPRPSDLDPTIQIGAYPFGLALFLKSP